MHESAGKIQALYRGWLTRKLYSAADQHLGSRADEIEYIIREVCKSYCYGKVNNKRYDKIGISYLFGVSHIPVASSSTIESFSNDIRTHQGMQMSSETSSIIQHVDILPIARQTLGQTLGQQTSIPIDATPEQKLQALQVEKTWLESALVERLQYLYSLSDRKKASVGLF